MHCSTYFETLRTVYQNLRVDFSFPSVNILTIKTSKVAKFDETKFSSTVFHSLNPNLKLYVILHEEVYVNKTMLYHGGQVFGKSVDDPENLAKLFWE